MPDSLMTTTGFGKSKRAHSTSAAIPRRIVVGLCKQRDKAGSSNEQSRSEKSPKKRVRSSTPIAFFTLLHAVCKRMRRRNLEITKMTGWCHQVRTNTGFGQKCPDIYRNSGARWTVALVQSGLDIFVRSPLM